MRAITLDEALKIIQATFAEAKRRNAYPLTAVLLDAGGRMKAALKQDGARSSEASRSPTARPMRRSPWAGMPICCRRDASLPVKA